MWALLVKANTDEFVGDTVSAIQDMLRAKIKGPLWNVPRVLAVLQRGHYGFAPFPDQRSLNDTKTIRRLCDVLDASKYFINAIMIGFPNGEQNFNNTPHLPSPSPPQVTWWGVKNVMGVNQDTAVWTAQRIQL